MEVGVEGFRFMWMRPEILALVTQVWGGFLSQIRTKLSRLVLSQLVIPCTSK
ncbi:hypothetical protein Scep_025536 [Stephania cephalantha]|uniref:Uncharacterized protein n=1 Tax=Stephania cephalantha TaxID=152367 RepID=A0AAP0ENN6_9MAGN